MAKLVRVQLPIKEELKIVGEKIAENYGLSSYQELIRFWTEQARRGNLKIEINDNEEILTPEQEHYLLKRKKELQVAEAKGEIYTASNIDEMMDQLNNADID